MATAFSLLAASPSCGPRTVGLGGRCYTPPPGEIIHNSAVSFADCDPGLACIDYTCVAAAACSADSDCSQSFTCSQTATDGTRHCATICDPAWTGVCVTGTACVAGGKCESVLGTSCDPTDPAAPCGVGAGCSPASSTCAMLPPCTDGSCGAFTCVTTPLGFCKVRCASDDDCAPSFACNTKTAACVSTVGDACSPASDDAHQCGPRAGCAATTGTCQTAPACTEDAPCGGYTCSASGYCLEACTATLPCALGWTCDAATHTCG